MEHKPGFYYYELYGKLGCVVALVYPDGKFEKIYIGDSDLLNSAALSDEWYETVSMCIDKYEYIGL
jgi:hypothetical protein